MLAEFKHTLRRLRGSIIGWSVGVALYGLMMALFFSSMSKIENLEDFYAMLPEEMFAFFGNLHAIGTPVGYIDVYFFSYLHVIVGILAISAGTGLLAGDEEKGTLDLVLAHPVSRAGLFWGRLLGLATALAIILTAGWLSWVLPAGSVGFDLSRLQILRPFLPLFAVLLLFAAAAMLLSMAVPSARIAAMLTGALLVGNYLLQGLSNMNEKLQPAMKYTPLEYYQAGMAIEGINGSWLAGLLLTALLLAAGAWLLFHRRDIRVGGERSWKLPALRKRSRLKSV